MKFLMMFLIAININVAQAQDIKFQITSDDLNMNDAFQRWAGLNNYKVYWNAPKHLKINHKTKGLEKINQSLAKQKQFKTAVLLALQIPENASTRYESSPLGMCILAKNTIAIYSISQENCGIK